jgi:hypothetical protein
VTAPSGKPVRLSAHARGYIDRRGFTEGEVEETIRTAPWQLAREGRWEASKEFPYSDLWNGTFFATKRIRAVFVETPAEIVVVTVYTYFF